MALRNLFPARGFGAASGPKSLLAPAEAKAAGVQLPPPLFWLPGNPYAEAGDTAATLTAGTAFAASALVYACMMFRARKLSEAPLWMREEVDGDEIWIPSTEQHPLAGLLEQPNPDQEMHEFIALLSLYSDMGPALVVKNRDRSGRVASLYLFAFDQFTVEAAVVDGVARLYGRFTVVDADGGNRVLGPDDVIYFPPLGGVAPLQAALAHVRTSESMRQAIRSALAKSIRPGSVTTVEGQLQPDTFERFKSQLMALYGGAENAGKNLVLESGAKFTPLTTSVKDLDPGSVNGTDEASICMAFGLHPILVGARIGLESMGGLADSLKPALSLFYDLAVFPRWAALETRLTAGLLREVDASPLRFVRFDREAVRALKPDLTARAAEAQTLADIWTVNERRAHTERPPLEAVVDATPGGQIATAPTPAVPAGDPSAAIAPVKAWTPPRAVKAAITTPAGRDAAWRDFDAKAAAGEDDYARTARRLFREERAGVLATLRAARPKSGAPALEAKATTAPNDPPSFGEAATAAAIAAALAAAFDAPYVDAALITILADYADGGAYHAEWFRRYVDLITRTVQVAGAEFAAALPAGAAPTVGVALPGAGAGPTVGVGFGMDNPRVVEAIRTRAAALVAHVTETTRAAITAAVAEGRAAGESMEQIADRIRDDVFGELAERRAITIAQTEVVGAINEAEWLSATGSGVFQSKRWLHTRTGEARDQHEAHEQLGWQPIDADYRYTLRKGGQAVYQRPHQGGTPAEAVVKCRCLLIYSDLDPVAAADAETKAAAAAADIERQRKLVDAAIVRLSEPVPVAPTPVVNVTIEAPPAGAKSKQVRFTTDPLTGEPIATLEESD